MEFWTKIYGEASEFKLVKVLSTRRIFWNFTGKNPILQAKIPFSSKTRENSQILAVNKHILNNYQ
jgi:hypothetical protein